MFLDREEAGSRLSVKLSSEKALDSPIIVAIPRGGVVVGKKISEILGFPLAILMVKKIGAPENRELAIGATGSNGTVFWDENLISYLGISNKEREKAYQVTIKTIKSREKNLGAKLPDVVAKTVIVVDDGVATGATARVASMILKKLFVKRLILATPVIARRTKKELSKYFDKIIAIETPFIFQAVGQFYRKFPQVEDKDVKVLLKSQK